MEITRTELVWPGKYNPDGTRRPVPRAGLPLQVVESIADSRIARPAGKQGEEAPLRPGEETETFHRSWRNRLIWGDNLLAMGSLLEELAGGIDLIYIDPPFATGSDFSFNTVIGDSGRRQKNDAPAIQEKAYRDSWGADGASYLAMISDRLRLLRELLRPDGSLFLHCDWHVGHLLRSVADEVFGSDNFLNEIVWYYYNKLQGNVNRFASNHDLIFWYRKGGSHRFEPQVEKRPEGRVKQLVRVWDKEKAAIVNAKGPDGRVLYRETDERRVDDVWRISMLQPADRTENCGFPTQKPEALLERILRAASSEGDLVADFFCGSGTTLAVAEKLGRRWIGCDLGRWGIHLTRKRLLGIEGRRPFQILSLGKNERRYWQGVRFGTEKASLDFILNLYGAQPIAGNAHLQGSKGKSMVHVGSLDLPVTVAEIGSALEECAQLGQRELHVLGWDWELDVQSRVSTAGGKDVKLHLLQIPREVMEQQAVEKGEVRFFELASIEAEVRQPGLREAKVELKNFVIPNPDLVSPHVRSRVEKWSDYIDYWAVDWDFRGETFRQGWAAYRTRKDRRLPLVSDPHCYHRPGRYRLLVKVIDIFGNDTSLAYELDVK